MRSTRYRLAETSSHLLNVHPWSLRSPKKDLLDPAIEGTLNVLRQAQTAGVTKVIITSSFAAINNFAEGGIRRDYTYTEADWNPAMYEQASAKDVAGAYAYSASKKCALARMTSYHSRSGLTLSFLQAGGEGRLGLWQRAFRNGDYDNVPSDDLRPEPAGLRR